jgi:ribonuclease J
VPGSTKIIPLGGLGEVGKNMTVIEADGEAVVIDAGPRVPRDEHLGVDLILPDFSYLVDRETADPRGAADARPRGPRRRAAVPAARGPRAGGLGDTADARLDQVQARRARPAALDGAARGRSRGRARRARAVHLPSSSGSRTRSPDAVAIVLDTPGGRILHTGDYKLDHTPVDGLRTDVGRLAELGNRGVDLFLGDSTNAERPGVTGSERLVGEAFRQLIPPRTGLHPRRVVRLQRHRMQQAADVAIEAGRKVCVVGRSMRRTSTSRATSATSKCPTTR